MKINLGKESNNLEENELFGVKAEDYQKYCARKILEKQDAEFRAFILDLKQKDAKKYHISKQTLSDLKKRIRDEGKIKLSKKVERRIGIAFNRTNHS